MLQHDRIYAVDCVYMDVQGDTVHLQVPLGECAFCETRTDISSRFAKSFMVII